MADGKIITYRLLCSKSKPINYATNKATLKCILRQSKTKKNPVFHRCFGNKMYIGVSCSNWGRTTLCMPWQEFHKFWICFFLLWNLWDISKTKLHNSGINLSSTDVTEFVTILTGTIATIRMTDGLHKINCWPYSSFYSIYAQNSGKLASGSKIRSRTGRAKGLNYSK